MRLFSELEPFISISKEIVNKTKTYSVLPVSGETIAELAFSYSDNAQAKLLIQGYDLTVMIVATILYSCSKGRRSGTIIVARPKWLALPVLQALELLVGANATEHDELIKSGYCHPLASFLNSENIASEIWQEHYPWYSTHHSRLKINFQVKSSPPSYENSKG